MLKHLAKLGLFAAMLCAAATARAETITVTHWGAAFYGAPYAVAMEKGFFKKHGVDITGILTSQGGGTSVRNTLAGDLPFGEVALPAAVEAINNGVPLRIIGGGRRKRRRHPVDRQARLADEFHQGPRRQEGRLHLAGLGHQHADPDGLQGPGHRSEIGQAGAGRRHRRQRLRRGQRRDRRRHVRRAGLVAEQGQAQPVFWTKDVLPPNMTQTVGIVTDEFAKTGGAKLRGIIEGRREGVNYIMAHPDEAAEITAKAYNGDRRAYPRGVRHFVAINYFGRGAASTTMA